MIDIVISKKLIVIFCTAAFNVIPHWRYTSKELSTHSRSFAVIHSLVKFSLEFFDNVVAFGSHTVSNALQVLLI